MTGCYTCGGGMGKHDPVAHDQVPEEEPCDVCGSYEQGHTHGPDPDDEQCTVVLAEGRCQRVAWHRGEHNPIPWQPAPWPPAP